MKKYLVSLIVMLVLFGGYAQYVSAQTHYVNERPKATVVIRTTAPSKTHVWVSDEWNWHGGRYENVPQHWEAAPAHHKHWVSGEWKHRSHHGNYWVPGHWK